MSPLRPRHLAMIAGLAWLASPLTAAAQNRVMPDAGKSAWSADAAQFRRCLDRAPDQDTAADCDSPLQEACDTRHPQPGTTIAIAECAMQANEAWDIALNERWRALLPALAPQARAKLRAAQRLWIGSRKADCEAVYEIAIAGTIRGPAFAACMAASTRDRYFFLRALGEG